MKVKELRKLLDEHDGNDVVRVSLDGHWCDIAATDAELTEELQVDETTGEEVERMFRVLVLYPDENDVDDAVVKAVQNMCSDRKRAREEMEAGVEPEGVDAEPEA